MMCVKGDVSIRVGWFTIDRCDQSIRAPTDLYIKKSQFAVLFFFDGELYVGVLLIDVFMEGL